MTNGVVLEQVNSFSYLGVVITDDVACVADIRSSISKGKEVVAAMKSQHKTFN